LGRAVWADMTPAVAVPRKALRSMVLAAFYRSMRDRRSNLPE
jgi:hypothetical protein